MRQTIRALAFGGGLALVAGLFAAGSPAQEPKSKTKEAPVAEPSKVAHAPGVHVPDFFGQIEPELTAEQREKIYEIQARALHESEAVLTPAQKTSLEQHRAKASRPARGSETPRKPSTRKKAG